MKDDISTPTAEGDSPNEFERDKPSTSDRSRAEAAIEKLRQSGGVFVNAVRATRMPMALTDPTLPGNPIVFVNESFLKLSGYSMDEVLGQQPHFMNGPDTDPKDAARFREALRADQDDVIETVQYRKNGSRFVTTVLISAFKDVNGKVEHHFMSFLDVTRRVDAEDEIMDLRATQAALKEREQQLSLVFQTMPVGVAVVDREGSTLRMNDEMRRFLPSGKIPSQDPERRKRWTGFEADGAIIEPDNHPGARAIRGEAVMPGIEMLYRQDDSAEIWTRVASVPMLDAQGAIVGAYVVVIDVDKAKRAEIELRESAEHERMLLAELQHRVRNTLAVVRSIAFRTGQNSTSIDDFQAHFEGRLNAFSRAQSAVVRSADGCAELRSIIEDELLALAAKEGPQLKIEGEDIELGPRVAESMSLGIHELATNSVKYGALALRTASLQVQWQVVKEGKSRTLRLSWTESGLDKPPQVDHEGFGHEMLLRSLPYDLGAATNIEFTADGMRFTMDLPLDHEPAANATR